MRFSFRGIRAALSGLALCVAGVAGAQENLDSGKTPAQLFASDCAICHKTPQGLAKSGGVFGLDSFLRQHYTASRETAAAIAAFLKAAGDAPAAPARKAVKRATKGDDKAKAGEKKSTDSKGAETKPADSKPGETKPADAKPADTKPSETKPAETKPAEAKPVEAKPAEAKPAEAKPAEAKPAEARPLEAKPAQAPKPE